MRATRGGKGRRECGPACVRNIVRTRLLTATCLRGRFGSTFSCCGADYCCQAGPGTAVLVSKGGRTETEAGGRAVRGTPRGPPSQLAGENAHTRLLVTRLPEASLPVCACAMLRRVVARTGPHDCSRSRAYANVSSFDQAWELSSACKERLATVAG